MRTEYFYISVSRVASGPKMKLAGCKSALNPTVVYSIDFSLSFFEAGYCEGHIF